MKTTEPAASIALPSSGKSILATGGELKNTFCLTKENRAFISRPIGDLNDFQAYQHYQKAIGHYKERFNIKPEAIAHDMHPDYLSTRYAMANQDSLPRIEVQHHHAHIASCMAEHRLHEEAIGVAFDGTGYGTDGNIWGGEFFVGGYKEFKRVYHLKYIPLPGGDKAALQPWRMAVSYIYQTFNGGAPKFLSRWKDSNFIISMIEKRVNSPLTSSMGRLFDAVSSIAGVCDINTYEAEAPIRLEALCQKNTESQSYPYRIENEDIDVSAMIQEILRSGEKPEQIATRFHNTIADIVLKVCIKIREKYKIDKVILSGGVFQNKTLTKESVKLLKRLNFAVYTHSAVPPNDGGVSLGQAVIAQQLGNF